MSDVWQGPGWWLASDGKWYPAEASPGAGDQSSESTTAAVDGGTTTVAEAVTIAPASNGQSSVTEDVPAASGWQAVEPDEEIRIESTTADLGDDLSWSEGKSDSGEWTNAYEVSPVDDPPAGDIADVVVDDQPPTVPIDAVLTDTITKDVTPAPAQAEVRRPTREPIERDDAWRKPSAGGGAPLAPSPYDAGAQTSPPEVVDLAIPAESPLNLADERPKPRAAWRSVMLGVLVVGAIVALAVLIGYLFNRFTDDSPSDDVDAGSSSTSVATTDASAPTTASTVPGGGQEVSVFELRPGDCIQGEISGQVQRLIRVDCAVPHEFEVYRAALVSSITEFDHDAISAQAQEVCREALANYIAPGDERDIKFKWFQPTEDSWAQEDREITCLLFDEAGPLTGRAAP